MWIGNFVGGAIILFFGLIVRIFKASNLIAGYNTASAEEMCKYDEEKLTKYVGNMLIISSIILLIGGFLSAFTNVSDYIIGISWVLFVLVILGGVVEMNIGDRVKK